MQREVSQVELLTQLEIVHIVEDGALYSLGKLDRLLLVEIDAMGRFGDLVRVGEIGLRARNLSLDGHRHQFGKLHELLLEFLRHGRRLDLKLHQVVADD